VESTEDASALSGATNCTGGTFGVRWIGSVGIADTISIYGDTKMTITGFENAVVDGEDVSQFLEVVGGEVHLRDIQVENCLGSLGGAIHAEDSVVTCHDTTFSSNVAERAGGAIYAGTKSTLSFSGTTLLSGNKASTLGGAIFAFDGSTVSFSDQSTLFGNIGSGGGAIASYIGVSVLLEGKTNFTQNIATGEGGGAILSGDSIVSWGGDTTFSENSAEIFGGAILSVLESKISWTGKTIFSNNTVQLGIGGAVAGQESTISWEGETMFTGNNAKEAGGSLAAHTSAVSWEGNTTFIENNSTEGGAIYAFENSTVTWDGNTRFSGNTADYGASLYVLTSELSWGGETEFFGNAANVDAGGVYLLNSEVLWDGKTSFVGNTAGVDGGAMVILKSTASWKGETIYHLNTAEIDGGAIDSLLSIISWGEKTTFSNNSAGLGGGAIGAGLTDISWDGVTTFSDNFADSGGAIHIIGIDPYAVETDVRVPEDFVISKIHWGGKTSFVNNIVSGSQSSSGGAIYMSTITMSWEDETIFSGNEGQFLGGAIYMTDSNTTWNGDTSFDGNRILFFSGGAVAVEDGSNVTWEGNTVWSNNFAERDGGALSVSSSNVSWSGGVVFSDNSAGSSGGAVVIESDSFLTWVDDATFSNNYCVGSGGAIALLGNVYITPGPLVLEENESGTSGGAMFISGTGKGPIFSKTEFISNQSPRGGAVYSASSGVERVKDSQDVFAVTYDRCIFTGNSATTSGGAVESVAGEDKFEGTIFRSNSAPVGGSLRLGGSAAITSCEFSDNVSSEDGGSAVSNLGVLVITKSTFSGNTFSCDSGKYLDSIDGDSYGAICDGCSECIGCDIQDGSSEPICVEQLANTVSGGGGSTIELLDIEPGYWRATPRSLSILECYNEDACGGGVTGESSECSEGYEGPYCSICSDGHSMTLSFTCEECMDTEAGSALMAIVVLVAMVAMLLLFKYLVSGEMDVKKQGIVHKTLKRLPLQSIKILIVVWQILTQFTSVANVTYPEVYQRFLDSVNVLNFDALWIPSVGCIIDVDFHDRLLMATIFPIVVLALLVVTFTLAKCRNKGSEEALEKVRERHMSMVLLVTFLVYSSVSSTIFQTFACEELDDGKDYLRVDYRIECDSSKHQAFQIFSGVMIFVYPIGIPLFYAFILYKNRTVLKDEKERETSLKVQPVDDLWRPYKPNRFYYEVIECFRRIMLTGVIVFIYPNTAAQVAVTLAIAFLFVIVSERLSPYVSKWDSSVSLTGHIIVFTSMYVALLNKVDISGERSDSQDVFAIILVAAHVIMIGVVVVETIFICLSLRDSGKEVLIPSPASSGVPVEIVGPVKEHSNFFFSEDDPI